MPINYIIATYGVLNRYRKYSWSEKTLSRHIEQLQNLKHNLSQITIMKPVNQQDNEHSIKYYQSLEQYPNIKIVECENRGLSNGQWIQWWMNNNIHEFDYYLCMEDDYCPGVDHFDVLLVDLFKRYFYDNKGVLTSLCQGFPKHENHIHPEHYEGMFFVSKETVLEMFQQFSQPLEYIEQNKYPEQVALSQLFPDHKDYLVEDYNFLFWCDGRGPNSNKYWYFTSPNLQSSECEIQDEFQYIEPTLLNNCPIIPVQLAKRCLVVLGMHRSGTSLFSGCLWNLGIDYGKSKAQVKDSFNEKGYFENMRLMHFNDKVLNSIGMSWKNVDFPLSTEQTQQILSFTDELCVILENEFTGNLFFIKDPRMMVLFELYQQAFFQLNIYPYFVDIRRNTDPVSKSLSRAQGISVEHAKQLHIIYTKYQDEILKNKRYFSVNMNAILTNLESVFSTFQKFINRDLTSNFQSLHHFIHPDLKHF